MSGQRTSTDESADTCARTLATLPGSLHAVSRSALETVARAAAGLTVAPVGQFADDAYRKVLADDLERLQACLRAAVERLAPLPIARTYGRRVAGEVGHPP